MFDWLYGMGVVMYGIGFVISGIDFAILYSSSKVINGCFGGSSPSK